MPAASAQVAEVGAGAGISLASFRRFWAVAARWELEDAFEVSEQHFDLFALVA